MTAIPASISTNAIRVQTRKSIADHVTSGTGRTRIRTARASCPWTSAPGGAVDPHSDARGGGLEIHTGPFSASLTGVRRMDLRADQTSRLSAVSVSRGPERDVGGSPAVR